MKKLLNENWTLKEEKSGKVYMKMKNNKTEKNKADKRGGGKEEWPEGAMQLEGT